MTKPRILLIDFETFWSTDYSLTKLSTVEYVRDPRFSIHGAAVKIDGEPARWFTNSQLHAVMEQLPTDEMIFVAHNAQFDGLILVEHFQVLPRTWWCTMAMAQALVVPYTGRASLAAVNKFYGSGEKQDSVLHKTKGRYWKDFSPQEQMDMAEYAKRDLGQMLLNLALMLPETPPDELEMIDWTVQAFLRQRLTLDINQLEIELARVIMHKDSLLARVGLADRTELMSNLKFAQLLIERGVDIQFKDGVRGRIPAFAKTDPFMQELLAHEDPDIQALAAARVGHKSTLIQTRCERLLRIAQASKGAPIGAPLRYHAAHTGRWGGTDDQNYQNMERVDVANGKGTMRKCLVAADGV